MATQLGVLLLLALLVSNLLAVLVLQRAGTLVHPLSGTQALERLAIAYRVAAQLPPAQALPLLRAMSSGEVDVRHAARAEVPALAMRTEERRLARELRRMLALPAATPVWMQLERIDGSPAREQVLHPAGWAPLRLRSSVRLPDGSWLNVVQHPAGGYEWGRLLAYSLPVSLLPVLLIAWAFMRRVVRPVRRLAQATERVSRGDWSAPLPLSGPREARELTAAFNTMQARLARQVESRTRMLAAISHDFGTPITELRLQLELLPPSPGRQDMLDSLADLAAMVRETLAFVRDDARQEPLQPFALPALLDTLARRYRRLGRPVRWDAAAPATCLGRPLALKRALGNLIDNALVHGGEAEVSLHGEAGGGWRLEVRDHGPGIPAPWLEQVFEPFVQLAPGAAAPEGGRGGMGLGLAIARACVQAQGGELVLENRRPGLCAIVSLPAAPARDPQNR
ncbi:two-component sensor histidine kinase [Xanthomonas arboricola pv. juglandis]|uniref:sensor histidine kinase n=1 Tax=Xanthomonas arboricola TaxID=56448 RepID=UPI000CEEA7A8|nr:HAMP domain-containing sensor histidine kinase [Xanthomonas arboricola]PPT96483.1 two-component sensor histidine kinase [Xanthomonas arboricola pv. juglandis]